MDPSAPLLQLNALAGRRGTRLLFRGVNLTLGAGEFVWLRGRNGSGKTSLLRLAAGLGRPAQGEVVRAGGTPVLLGHTNALKDELTVAESLHFLLGVQGLAQDAATVDGALDRFGLAARRHQRIGQLSQGQRRRVALARLAASRTRPLWLLDEPHDGLDADGAQVLDALLAEHLRSGGSVLMASHQAPSLPGRVLDLDAH
ncbi:MAG: heme ABC exporter ATP-binding protein CcmA [Caldimonas sp.]|uniref:heme ABC exporter ATP-binding protein CcmA n=1 Tax=Caldimonas sp. TaxID=2838790 RepID=UPI00391CEFC5